MQAVEELKKKLQGLKELFLGQVQSFHTAVHAHEAVSTSTFKTLECTVAAHPTALEQVCTSKCRCRGFAELEMSTMVDAVLDSVHILDL